VIRRGQNTADCGWYGRGGIYGGRRHWRMIRRAKGGIWRCFTSWHMGGENSPRRVLCPWRVAGAPAGQPYLAGRCSSDCRVLLEV